MRVGELVVLRVNTSAAEEPPNVLARLGGIQGWRTAKAVKLAGDRLKFSMERRHIDRSYVGQTIETLKPRSCVGKNRSAGTLWGRKAQPAGVMFNDLLDADDAVHKVYIDRLRFQASLPSANLYGLAQGEHGKVGEDSEVRASMRVVRECGRFRLLCEGVRRDANYFSRLSD
jgi:hypothetical protein